MSLLKVNKTKLIKYVIFGGPQGSVSGPLLFSMDVNDLPLHVSSGRCDMLVDDTIIPHLWERYPLTAALHLSVSDFAQWTYSNQMSLDPSKTIQYINLLSETPNNKLAIHLCIV